MAVPIFTLAEDAFRNVPRGFRESSYALRANRRQTIVHVLVPAALSGIVSAVLLGLGRAIGETMVMLLCAGNRIAIPDFTQGLGAFFQAVHTMTGIIAQEMGEVVGTALLVVGSMIVALVIGISAAIYLSEYSRDTRFIRFISVAILNLAGVPSIVFGLFGFGLFVIFLGGTFRCSRDGSTLGLMILPAIITASEESFPGNIGPSTGELSGGQQQRLCIAKSFLCSKFTFRGYLLGPLQNIAVPIPR
jgi:ABC-type phosphate transport system permease subunit